MLVLIFVIIQYFLLIVLIGIMTYIAYIMFSFRNMVPYVPTPRKYIKLMIELARIKNGERVCDLGSGTGRIIIRVAKKHKKNLIIGIEHSKLLKIITNLKLLFFPGARRRIQVINKDFLNIDLSNFNVIFCFSTPEALRLLTPQFKTLNRGSRIISYMFHIEDHKGFTEEIHHPTRKDSVYVYTKE